MTDSVLPRAALPGMLRSEWTKLRTVRSTVWSLVAMAAIALGLMSLIAWAVIRQWDTADPSGQEYLRTHPLELILSRPVFIAQLVVAVLGVMVISAEYTTGMIRSTLQAQPRRLTVLSAKVLVFAGLMLAVGELLSFGAYFLGKAIISAHVPVSLSDPGVARAVIGAGLFTAMLGLFSLALGAIIRHTAGAITTVLGLILIVSQLTSLLPGTWGARVHAWMPTNAGALIFEPTVRQGSVLTPWEGFAVFSGWTAVLLIIAAYLFKSRDA
ncbi:ABC transporter permease [Dactylosporangium sp. NPDC000244]|uniref:ABC transporter permease n=1 Tax=Dactylosporangium sp. NPDC000244 TaxID=3154365 RepID=UPI0033246409